MKWNLHQVVKPLSSPMTLAANMSSLSHWRARHPVRGYNDFYQRTWDYNRRYLLYDAIAKQEGLDQTPIDYLEFGVAGGLSLRWWLEKNKLPSSRFFGFDTFEGLPEKWGHFKKGDMAVPIETLDLNDQRASLHKGLFQDSLIPFLNQYDNKHRKLIHIDSDLFSSGLFVMTQLYRFLRPGDIFLFDEFAVPEHEFFAWKIFTESFYIDYDVIGAANNYLFVATKIK